MKDPNWMESAICWWSMWTDPDCGHPSDEQYMWRALLRWAGWDAGWQ